MNIPDVTVGKDLEHLVNNASLVNPAPSGNLKVTIISSDPARVLVSQSSTSPGAESI